MSWTNSDGSTCYVTESGGIWQMVAPTFPSPRPEPMRTLANDIQNHLAERHQENLERWRVQARAYTGYTWYTGPWHRGNIDLRAIAFEIGWNDSQRSSILTKADLGLTLPNTPALN